MGEIEQPKLNPNDLLTGDPRWMMYPGEGYEYVSLKSGYTGVKDREGKLFAIETDGLVIVRLWPVIGNDVKLLLDMRNPLPRQTEVLKPARFPSRLKKIDWDVVEKWASYTANKSGPFELAMYDAGSLLQQAVIHCEYVNKMSTPDAKYKGPVQAQRRIENAFKLLGDAVAANAATKPPNGGIQAAAEMLIRIASGKSIGPRKPPASVCSLVSNALFLAKSRRRTLTVRSFHNAIVGARKNYTEAKPLMVAFNPALEFMPEPDVPDYKHLAKAFSDIKQKLPAVAGYVLDGKLADPM